MISWVNLGYSDLQMTNGEDSSDKENSAPARAAAQARAGSKENVITASTWLSNIMPAPKEELDRELSPSPQHRAVQQVLGRGEWFKEPTLLLELCS